jgi:hypothetical protein
MDMKALSSDDLMANLSLHEDPRPLPPQFLSCPGTLPEVDEDL